MSKYLITLSIGPVQDFIAAARKTRDLWLGSNLLSEISKSAALSFYKTDNDSLIFPAPEKPDNDLQPQSDFNVGNKILVLIETDNAKQELEKAKTEAKARWLEIANQAKSNAEKQGVIIDDIIWNHQINDVLELYGSWVKYDESKSYRSQRERLDQLVNARKNTRDFKQNPVAGNGIPKSSLDGLRENLITVKDEKTRRRAGLRKGEYLDCTGVVKRLGEDPEQFTPISRIGIDPWLRGISDDNLFSEIKEALGNLVKEGLVSRVKGNKKIYENLPYDGQLLYPFRLSAEKNTASSEVKELLATLEEAIKNKKLYQNFSEPLPYVAIVQADGDHMGKLLDNMQTPENHRNISQTLAKFATDVPALIRKHSGHCIYAGGDDVLALVPLDQVIRCSRELADNFKTTMNEVKGISDDLIPTLSVGVGISHIMTPMGKQLDLARKAESLAKGNDLSGNQPKNSLAIIFQPRSGADISFREKWTNDNSSADTILDQWIQSHLSGEVPRQTGYNLREESIALDWHTKPDGFQQLLDDETQRILGKKRVTQKDGTEKSIDTHWVNAICDRVTEKGMREAADELIMTYRIAQAYQQANHQTNTTEGKTDV